MLYDSNGIVNSGSGCILLVMKYGSCFSRKDWRSTGATALCTIFRIALMDVLSTALVVMV